METEYIREFAVLAEYMNFSEAADALFLSQSSLSKHIMSLERALGTKLFSRTTRKMQLTEAGGVFLNYAQQISSLMSAGEGAVSAVISRHSSTFTLGVQTPKYYDIVKYITGFRWQHPDITVNLVESDDQGLLEMFLSRQLNIFTAIIPPTDDSTYHFLPVRRTHVNAIMRSDHRLAGRHAAELSDLEGESLMLPSRGSSQSRLILAALRDAGITPSIAYEGSSDACIELLRQSTNVALHSAEFSSPFSDDPDLSVLPVSPAITFTYGLGYRDPSEMSAAENCYLKYIEETADPALQNAD
jgi:LysR family transcriptional activator of glutamate synthase operon